MLDTCRMSGAGNKEGATSRHEGSLQHEGSLHSVTKTAGDGASETAASADSAGQSQPDDADDREHQPGGSQSPKPPSSPEPNCAICLGQLENKSFTDSCFHMFCFVCLQEWSKVKAECPLCKQPFKSIIHNVRSYNMYDQFYLEHRVSPPQRPLNRWYWDRHAAFRLMLPFNVDHRYMRHRWDTSFHLRSHAHGSRSRPSDLEPSLMRPSRRGIRLQQNEESEERDPFASSRHLVSTIDFRRRLYLNGYRVTGVRSSLRYRHISPEFFRNNPAQTHRLIPWLNRELNALLYGHESQVQFVMELIQDLIKRFAIDSEEFYQHVSPYIGRYTRHFMHEFLMFARSPYIMGVYDTKALYQPSAQMISSSESSGEDSDVVVIDDDDAEEAGRPGDESGREGAGSFRRGQANEPPSVRQEFSSSSEQTVASSQLRRMLDGGGSANSSTNSGWDSPTPGPSWDLGAASDFPVNVVDSSDSEASTIINPANQSSQDVGDQGTGDESDEGDEVIFVGYDKPWEERSPIQLSSGSDDESYSKFAKQLARSHKHRMAASDGRHRQPQSQPHAESWQLDRAWAATSPAAYRRSRSPHKRKSRGHREGSVCSIGHRNRSSSVSSSHRREKRHRKHRHSGLEDSEQLDHLSSGSQAHGSKHHSHSRSHKKHRRERMEEDTRDVDQPRKKKHKKKHKKHRERSESGQHSTKHQGSHSSSSRSRRDSCSTVSSRERGSHREWWETCKKHPSGHKKSRLQAGREECRDRYQYAHTSTSMLETSRSERDGSSSRVRDGGQILSWNPLHIMLGNHPHPHQQQSEFSQTSSYFSLSSVDVPSHWENMVTATGLIEPSASCTVPQSVTCENSSQEPVVITSSDESDHDYRSTEQSTDDNSGSSLTVAQTVVVPCSSHLNVPTEGINFSSPSAGGLRSCVSVGLSGGGNDDDEECIDVDSLSSSDKMSDTESEEILDVESVSEVEGESQLCVDSGTRVLEVAEVCAEPPATPVPVELGNSAGETAASVPSLRVAGEERILVKDVFMGVAHSSQLPCNQSPVASFGAASVSADLSHSHCQSQGRSVGGEEARSVRMSYTKPSNSLDAVCPSAVSKVRHSVDTSCQDDQREGPVEQRSYTGDETDKSHVPSTLLIAADSVMGGKAKERGASRPVTTADSVMGGKAKERGASCPVTTGDSVMRGKAEERGASRPVTTADSVMRGKAEERGASHPVTQVRDSESGEDVGSSSSDEACDDDDLAINEEYADETDCVATSSGWAGSSNPARHRISLSSPTDLASEGAEENKEARYQNDEPVACHSSSVPEITSENENEEGMGMATVSSPPISEANDGATCTSSRKWEFEDNDREMCDSSSDREAPQAGEDLSSANMLSSTDLELLLSSDELDTTESHGSLSSIVDVPTGSSIISVSTNSIVSRSPSFLLVQHQQPNLDVSDMSNMRDLGTSDMSSIRDLGTSDMSSIRDLGTSDVRDSDLSCFEAIDADSSENNERIPSELEDQVSASFSPEAVCEFDRLENHHLDNSLHVACEGGGEREADSSSTDDELGACVSNIHDTHDHGHMDEADAVSSSGVNSVEQSESCLRLGAQDRQAAEHGGNTEPEDADCVSECDRGGADSWGDESCQWSDLNSEEDTESGVDSSGVNNGQYVSDHGETMDHVSR